MGNEAEVLKGGIQRPPARGLQHQDSRRTASTTVFDIESVGSAPPLQGPRRRPNLREMRSDIFASGFRSRSVVVGPRQLLRNASGGLLFGFERRTIRELLVLMINTITFFYPTLMEIVLSVFVCNRVDSANGDYSAHRRATAQFGYWYLDMYTPCFQGRHLFLTVFVGILGSMLICVGLPLWLWYLLHRARSSENSAVREQLMFLSHPFHDRHFYWECVRMLQLFAMIALKIAGALMSELVQVELL